MGEWLPAAAQVALEWWFLVVPAVAVGLYQLHSRWTFWRQDAGRRAFVRKYGEAAADRIAGAALDVSLKRQDRWLHRREWAGPRPALLDGELDAWADDTLRALASYADAPTDTHLDAAAALMERDLSWRNSRDT